jgi:hypothetical protein
MQTFNNGKYWFTLLMSFNAIFGYSIEYKLMIYCKFIQMSGLYLHFTLASDRIHNY